MMIAGLSESFVPLFVAFAFLSVAWLLVAVGLGGKPSEPWSVRSSRSGRALLRPLTETDRQCLPAPELTSHTM